MSRDDLDTLIDAPTPSKLGAAVAQPALDEPLGFTLDHADEVDGAADLPVHRLLAVTARHLATRAPHAIADEARDPREESALYAAMGLGIACTVVALAMLVAGFSG